MIKRLLDVTLALLLLMTLAIPMLAIAFAIRITSPGTALYKSDRVGLGNRIFSMYKFRTMRKETPAVATHLMTDADRFITPVGRFLRKTSLDELPQLFNIVKGDMTFVGPRPALFNQDDLVTLRTERGIHLLIPGLTGWAQVNGRDELPIPVKVEFDDYYRRNQTVCLDIKILLLTALRVLQKKGVSH